jgi:hypothetical protein
MNRDQLSMHQRSALFVLSSRGDVTPGGYQPWMQKALMALVRRGLAEKVEDRPPVWRITDDGRATVESINETSA